VYSNSVSHRRLVIDKCASDGSVRTDDDDRTGTDVRKTFVVFAGAFGRAIAFGFSSASVRLLWAVTVRVNVLNSA